MGATQSGSGAPYDPNKLETWKLQHVQMIYDKYVSDNFDFGVTKPDFKTLMTAVDGSDELADDLWDMMDPKQAGMIATLEALCALIVGCQGDLDGKVDLTFNCFDFNNGGDISYDEMVILMSSALSGMVKLAKQGMPPDDAEMEKLTDNAFLDADSDMNGTIHKKEFSDWVKNQIAQNKTTLTTMDILQTFGLITADQAAESAPAPAPTSEADPFAVEESGGGDQSSAPPAPAPAAAEGSGGVWSGTVTAGVGSVKVEHTGSDVVFDLNGKTAQCQDHGFSSVSDLQQFAKLFATRLKVEGKKKDLVLGPWKHNDDLKDFLQLCIVNLADKATALKQRKVVLDRQVAAM